MGASGPEREGIRPGQPLPAGKAARALRPSTPAMERAAPAAPSDALYGTQAVERRLPPIMGSLYLLLTLGLLTAYFLDREGLYPARLTGAVAAASFALVYLCLRPRRRTLRISADGVDTGAPEGVLPYRKILEVFAPGRRERDSFPIFLLHEAGFIELPAKLRPPSRELLSFLRSQPRGRRKLAAVAPVFEDFLKKQTAVDGPDGVYLYRPRDRRVPYDWPTDWRRNRWRRLALPVA
jgi:hypothetical protein